MAFTLDNTTSLSSEVAVVKFAGFADSLWNTADGKRPEPMTTRGSLRLYTIANLQILSVVSGDVGDGPFLADGGKLGCDEWTYSSAPELKAGEEYVAFLSYSVSSDGKRVAKPSMMQAWPLNGDRVETPMDGTLSLDQLIKRVRGVDLAPWPPREPSN